MPSEEFTPTDAERYRSEVRAAAERGEMPDTTDNEPYRTFHARINVHGNAIKINGVMVPVSDMRQADIFTTVLGDANTTVSIDIQPAEYATDDADGSTG